jgi:Putative MetA-pathway of phenol degradation
MKPTTSLLAAMLATLSVPASAQDDDAAPAPALEHGKAATADASPVDPGALEFEVGYSPLWSGAGGTRGFVRGAPASLHAFSATLTHGVAPGVDAKVSAGFGSIHDEGHLHADGSTPRDGAGTTDLVLGSRWRFVNLPGDGLELAVTADVIAPTGAPHTPERVGLTQGFWSARGALVATKDLGALTANGELAWTAPLSGGAGAAAGTVQANAALGCQLTPWLQPEVEVNYQATVGHDAHVLAATAGIVAPLRGGHRVVAAVQRALWGRNAVETTAAVFAFKTAL